MTLLAYLNLVPVDLMLIHHLDLGAVTDGAGASCVVVLVTNAGSSMCFGHVNFSLPDGVTYQRL